MGQGHRSHAQARRLVVRFAMAQQSGAAIKTREDALRRLDQLEHAVKLRLDVFANADTGLRGRNSKTVCNRWVPTARRDRYTLENMFEDNPMMTRIIGKEPQDAIQPGFTVDGLTEEQQADVQDFLGRREFYESLIEAGTWERLFGGAAIFMELDDGQDPALPVSPTMIREFGKLTVLDRHDIFVAQYNTDLRSGRFLSPSLYQLAEGSQFVHPSRLLIFPGIKLTRRRMRDNQGWGGSVANAVWHKLEQWDTTGDYLAEAVTRHSQGVLKFENLKKSLIEKGGAEVEARIEALGVHMGILGDVALDKNEEYTVVARGMSGFGEANGVAVDGLVAVTDQPKSILMGLTIGGLNSGGNEGDWETWTSHLAASQKRKYQRQAIKALRYIFAAGNSPLAEQPERITITWGTLFQLSETEIADNTVKYATAANSLILSNVMLPSEARQNEQLTEAFNLDAIDLGEEELADPGREEEIDPAAEAELIEGEGGEGESEDSAHDEEDDEDGNARVLPIRG